MVVSGVTDTLSRLLFEQEILFGFYPYHIIAIIVAVYVSIRYYTEYVDSDGGYNAIDTTDFIVKPIKNLVNDLGKSVDRELYHDMQQIGQVVKTTRISNTNDEVGYND